MAETDIVAGGATSTDLVVSMEYDDDGLHVENAMTFPAGEWRVRQPLTRGLVISGPNGRVALVGDDIEVEEVLSACLDALQRKLPAAPKEEPEW